MPVDPVAASDPTPNTSETGYQSESSAWWSDVLNPGEIPDLQWPKNIEVYDKMRRTDDQVLSVLRAVTLPIRSTEWSIDGTGCRPEVTKLVADDLGLSIVGEPQRNPMRTKDRFDWDEHLRLVLLKLVFGHSFFEQVYTYNRAERRYHLRKLAWRPPRTIEKITVARDGGLESITQQPTASTTTREEPPIPVSALVAHVNDREGGNWFGQSLLRSAYPYWLLKAKLLRVQAQTVERNGMGINVYTGSDYKDDDREGDELRAAQKEEREAGLKAARALRSGTTAGAAVPFSAKLESMGVTGELPDAEKPLNRYDAGIARSVLAHFLTLGGDDSTGSYALGSTFAQFFVQSLQAVTKEIAGVINQHVIEDLVDANWGTEEPAPRLVFQEIGTRQALTPEGVRALMQSGAVEADDATEEYLRKLFTMPAKDKSTTRKLPTSGTGTAPGTPPDGENDDPAKTGEQEDGT